MGFVEDFIHWIKLLLNNQQSCVLNRGFTIAYFNLENGARQGGPILAYLFIFALEALFELIKNNGDIREIIFNHAFFYTTFADESTFSLMTYYQSRILLTYLKYFLFSRD